MQTPPPVCYNFSMNVNLSKYSGKNICVAVSGGKDSMALLHYLWKHGGEYGIRLSALNCDHGFRKEASARDSAFVKEWCSSHHIPLLFFKASAFFKRSEAIARTWRLKCYLYATMAQPCDGCFPFDRFSDTEITAFPEGSVWKGADAVATAHHLNDNAETVLFRLARGAALSGLTGITDIDIDGTDGGKWSEIRPLIGCSREDIDGYIAENNIPYVTDESNFTDDYTRNKIRHNVLPELEEAVPGAAKAIYRFSRLAADDEEYFERQIEKIIVKSPPYGESILFCEEKVLFRRAAIKLIAGTHQRKDYTSDMAERLYRLQFAENGKRFSFLGLTAFKEEGKITVVSDEFLAWEQEGMPYETLKRQDADNYCGQYVSVVYESELDEALAVLQELQAGGGEAAERVPPKLKLLKFDLCAVPEGAVVRFMRAGDRFQKFGGGTKNLGDYFTDKKISVRLRCCIPLIVSGSDVLAVCGVEISDKIKVTKSTRQTGYIICADYAALK